MLLVKDNLVVSMDYTLRLADGEIADSSASRGPLEFIQGQGRIVSGLERSLVGMAVGEEREIVVSPDEAYGEFDPDLFETLPRSVFPADMELSKGLGFRMRSQSGRLIIAYVDSVSDEEVVVNLNHPLAGETLHFDVKIASLREASDDELAGGCDSCSGCGDGSKGGCCLG